MLENIRVRSMEDLPKPKVIKATLVPSKKAQENIAIFRKVITNIINNNDDRRLVISGPCSIHDPQAALDYAYELHKLYKQYEQKIVIVMRVYFEKPRTQVGWKGFINDPQLDGSNKIYEGLFRARELLIHIAELGLPVVTEWLDTITPQYIADLVSLGMSGARTTESQIHRQLVSGISMPVGFKNTLTGNVQVPCDAIKVAEHPQSFLGTNDAGDIVLVHTTGNPDTFVVLRGSQEGTNYDHESIYNTIITMKNNNIRPSIIVDCSHGNSRKNYKNQEHVARSVINQIEAGNNFIKGIMLESNLHEGAHRLEDGDLKYGVSITDSCINLNKTKELINYFYNQVEL